MGRFLSRLVVGKSEYGEYRWELHEKLVYQTSDDEVLVVPQGFWTDFASIPRIFWNILPPWGEYDKAAVLHDYLYFSQFSVWPREDADALFLEAMESQGVGWFKRNLIYRAVRCFGWMVWETYKAKRNP